MTFNPLVLATREEMEQADDLLLSLTTLAKPSNGSGGTAMSHVETMMRMQGHDPVSEDSANPPPVRRSRFFYSPTQSFAEEVNASKSISEEKSLPHDNDEINSRVIQYSEELPTELGDRIHVLREYLLREWAPTALSANAATAQFIDVAQRTLGTAIDPAPLVKFERMIDRALTIKMADFVTKYAGLPKNKASDLLNSVAPQPQQALIVHPHDDEIRAEHERRRRASRTKNSDTDNEKD